MSSLDQIISVEITQQTSAVAGPSFQIPLIIGSSMTGWTDSVHGYSDPAGMLSDGFTTTSPEYKYAIAMFSQPISPTQFFVGKRTTAVAQVSTLAVSTLVASGHAYSFMLEGSQISYTSASDTQQSILTNLLAAINAAFPTNPPVTGVVSGSGTGALLTLTAPVAGAGFAITGVDTDLTLASPTANHGIADDLTAIIAENNTWYGIVLCSNVDADILQLSMAVEALKKIFIASTTDAAVATSATTDIASLMKSETLARTALVYSPLSANKGIDAAWMGGQLPQTPGSNNWAFNTLVGIAPDVISEGAQGILIGNPVAQVPGKNVNIYQTVGGANITQMGTMAGGQFIDLTIGIDWLESTIQFNIFNALRSQAKIAYTDNGVGTLLSAVRAAIDQGVTNGLIDGKSNISVTAPLVLSVPQSQRAGRVSPTISFSCRLAGALNAVVVKGTVSV